MEGKPRLLLHICCAPCSTYPIETLRSEYGLELLFYNPNIHPETEYRARLKEARRYARRINVSFHELDYDSEAWFDFVRGLEGEPEAGARCRVCYSMRLDRTARFAKENGIGLFTTALSVSPHKSAATINLIGRRIAEDYSIRFYEADFKKKEGFKIAARLSREAGLYRQDYCGCAYSKREVSPSRRQA